MMESSTVPPVRAIDRLSELANRRQPYHRHFGGGSTRRLVIVVGVVFGVFVLFYLGARSTSFESLPVWNAPSESGAVAPPLLDGIRSLPPESGREGREEAAVCLPGHAPASGEGWSESEMRAMVARTKGYYARDWSLGLGFSQMRFIIETALLHAMLLNRTLILPSYVHARACEFQEEACAAFAEQINRDTSMGWSSQTGRTGWRIPLGVMIDLPHLRKTHPVLLTSEFLALHSLPLTNEQISGSFNRDVSPLSLSVIPNKAYDPSNILRVDRLPKMSSTVNPNGELGEKVRKRMQERMHAGAAMDYDTARLHLSGGPIDVRKDEVLEKALNDAGLGVVYSFKGVLDMEFVKSVAHPIRQVIFHSAMKGFAEEFGDDTADVLLLEGEVHLNRKAGSMRFTTKESRDAFIRTAVYAIRPAQPMARLAERLDQRIRERNDGRLWVGAHMRRGDFSQLGWVMESSLQKHLDRIKERFKKGIQTIREIKQGGKVIPYDIPDVLRNHDLLELSPPLEHDKFFIATDVRDATDVAYLRSNGALLIQDLLTPDDRQLVGQHLLLKDVLAVLEHALLAKAAYYYGHAMSAVGGTVLNMRAAEGADERTALID